MKTAMTKTAAMVVAALAASFALSFYLRYFGEFSSSQSLALTVIACVALVLFLQFGYSRKAKDARLTAASQAEGRLNMTAPGTAREEYQAMEVNLEGEFVPFHVEVHPEWHGLLKDFKLVADDKEANRLWEESGRVAVRDFDLMRHGPVFTVLQRQSDALLPGLTFLENRKTFMNGLDLQRTIPGIRIGGFSPELYLRGSADPNPMRDGDYSSIDWKNCKPEFVWELGLIVPEKWWGKACDGDSALAQVPTETYSPGVQKRVVIARLPYSEFDIYFRPNVHFHDGLPDMTEFKRRREKLIARGWEWDQDEIPDEDGVTRVRHKYFIVSHKDLDKRGNGGA